MVFIRLRDMFVMERKTMQIGDTVKVLYGYHRNKTGVIIQDRTKQSFYDWAVKIEDSVVCYWSAGLQAIEAKEFILTPIQ